LFKIAGFNSVLHPIPNEYYPQYSYWYRAETDLGDIKIGWRKRVINIDWSSTKRNLEPFFSREEVTKTEYSIHAWGYAKCLEYLTQIELILSHPQDVFERLLNQMLESNKK
jgi:hypothetical protein